MAVAHHLSPCSGGARVGRVQGVKACRSGGPGIAQRGQGSGPRPICRVYELSLDTFDTFRHSFDSFSTHGLAHRAPPDTGHFWAKVVA
jgi:hypothetical protein